MRGEFVTPDDPRWTALLETVPHDFYHLPDYLRFCGGCEGGEPMAFHAEEGEKAFLLPLLVRQLPSGLGAPENWRDASTPYGYSSPLLRGDGDDLRRFMAAFLAAAARQGIVSAFLRLHPLLPLPPEPLSACGTLVRHGPTVSIDLSRPAEEIRRGFRENHRRDIRRLARDGFRVVFDDWKMLDAFAGVYRQTMKRLHADSFYVFPRSYFSGLRACLGDRLHLGAVLSPDGEVSSAALFVRTGGIVQYHLGGTAEAYLSRAPSKLLFDYVARWGQMAGARTVHLGGGVGGRADSLFRFKEGFSRETRDFHTLRIVVDPERYARLADGAGHAGQEGEGGYFPLYRRPASETLPPLQGEASGGRG